MPLQPLVLRLVKGSPLTAVEGDQNLARLRDGYNSLEQIFLQAFGTDGLFKAGSISNINMFTTAVLQLLQAGQFSPGDVKATVDPNAQTGWLFCDGSAVSRVTYADLFAVIGTTYGVGDGVTTFNLPDFQGRSPIGTGMASGGVDTRVLGTVLGEEKHTLIATELPAAIANLHFTLTGSVFLDQGGSDDEVITTRTDGTPATLDGSATISGGGQGHNNISPSFVIRWLIKV